MTVKHHLVAIILRVDEKWTYRIDLSPGDSPEVEFMVPHGTNVVSYSFCNLHGLHRSQAVSE